MRSEDEIRKEIKIIKEYAKCCQERKEYENLLCANKKLQALEWVLQEDNQ